MSDSETPTPSIATSERESVFAFWFGDPRPELSVAARRWFQKDAAFDAEIRERFLPLMERAQRGELDDWMTGEHAAKGALALVILLDQMSRNVYRGTPASFAHDGRALAACLGGIGSGADHELSFSERYMFYMPLMHAEDRELQRRAVREFDALAREAEQAGVSEGLVKTLVSAREYAERHQAIVERFGRFPHRNAILGRTSTPEETAFLAEPGSSF